MTPQPNPRHWVELDRELEVRGLMLIDISRDSKIPDRRSALSIQYLSNLRVGRNGFPRPNNRVMKQLVDAIGCTADDLKRRNVEAVGTEQ